MTTTYPSSDVENYELSSNGHVPDSLGIPTAGVIAITVGEQSVASLKRAQDPQAATQTAAELLGNIIGTPSGATNLLTPIVPHDSVLDGTPAVTVEFTYSFNGLRNVQYDVVARHRDDVVSVELDTEPALASRGLGSLNALLTSWRWR